MYLPKLVALPLALILSISVLAQQAVKPGTAQQQPSEPSPASTPPGQAAPGTPATQQGPAAPDAPSTPPGPAAIKIVVLEGEGAKNDLRSGTAIAPRVQVLDEGGKPVPGAEVVFALPMGGASGIFHGWVRTQTVRTTEDGVASVTDYVPNEIEGRFNIKVTAKAGTQQATAVIAQSNVREGSQKGSNKKWWILAAAAAGAGIGIGIAAANGDSTGTVSSPIVISAGAVTVGGPK